MEDFDEIRHEQGVQSINRAFQILEALAENRRGMSITELVALLGLNKSTVHRILNAMLALGYVTKDEKSKDYRLGIRVVALGSHYLNGLELKTEALPFMESLQQQTSVFVHLGMLDDNNIVYLEKIGPYTHFRMFSQIGRRVPIYSTGLGKAIFAQLNVMHQNRLLNNMSFEPITKHTVQNADDFLRDIVSVQERGYAIDEQENEEEMRCVAAPIFDYSGHVIAAVSCSGFINVFTEDKIPLYGQYVMDCANAISAQMGYCKP